VRIIGIDLGKDGYIVELDSEKKLVRALAMPLCPDATVDSQLINSYFSLQSADYIITEQMNIPPTFGAASAFKFGWHCGQWSQILKGTRYKQLPAVRWQKIMHEGFTSDFHDSKKRSIAAFYRLNPHFKYPKIWGRKRVIDHNFADAFLIALFALMRLGISHHINWQFVFVAEKS
jgi:hypothetical protein